MKKRCSAEKTGLRIEPKATKFFRKKCSTELLRKLPFIVALLLSQKIFPQIPINGFCKYQEFPIQHGFNSLLALNFNNDSYTDLILYNPDSKKILSIDGESNGTFGKPKEINSAYQITAIQNLTERSRITKQFGYVSRQNRRAGILSFTGTGHPVFLSSVKFNSYPENISAADIDQSGKEAMLISGSAFDGLSILLQTGSKIVEKKIVQQTSFSEAAFADLSNDGFSDIAAFNVMSNSLLFYYNDGTGRFSLVRSFPLDAPIHLLKAADMNLDNYTDLIYAKKNSIVIMYGDYVSAYNKITTIKTKYTPDKIITGDFNRDGKIDIAYINKEEGILSVFFAKDEYTFFPEVIYMKKEGLENLIPYYSKFVNAIVSISDSGSIYSISNLASIPLSASLITSPRPSAINYFDHSNNGIIDICYIDNYTASLDLIVRNNAGIPSFFFSYPLYMPQKKILLDNTEARVKTFYCYTPGKRLIEVLKIDFDRNTLERSSMYSPGSIFDIKLNRQNNTAANIYIAYSKRGNLGLSIFEYHDYRYTSVNYDNISSNVFDASLSLMKLPEIYYWSGTGGNRVLSHASFGSKIENVQSRMSIPVKNDDSLVIFSGDLLNNNSNASVTFLNYENNSPSLIYCDNKNESLRLKETPEYFKIDDISQLFYGPVRFNGINKLCAYLPEKNFVVRIGFVNGGRDFSIAKLADAENVESYFIKNMSFRNYHLVYVDKQLNCIKIQEF